MQMKALTLHVECREEQGRKRAAKNESLTVLKRQIISLAMNGSCPKQTFKETKLIAESLDEQYEGIGIHIASMFTPWCGKEVEELQHFNT